jgi:hypothetical protein
MSLQQDLLAIERTFWTGGPEAYQAHTDKECLVVFSDTAGVMKREDIAKQAEKGRWQDVSFEPKGLAELDDRTAVVSYECRAKRKDGQPYHAVVSSAYVKRPDGWKMAFHQQTPLQ